MKNAKKKLKRCMESNSFPYVFSKDSDIEVKGEKYGTGI